ncbi:hypothetical protein GW17_00054484 [Ensete ventricosum]|nr:hypothetical protein GW17_00054484 [Ensete ventricosum]RZR83855.1 hypothetical protein BHM03_00010573 [Ensete ventricosum]
MSHAPASRPVPPPEEEVPTATVKKCPIEGGSKLPRKRTKVVAKKPQKGASSQGAAWESAPKKEHAQAQSSKGKEPIG